MFKRNIIAGLVGLIIVGGFLGIVCGWLKAIPLIVVCTFVMALALYDFFTAIRDISDNRET
jgi:hypothetical protein